MDPRNIVNEIALIKVPKKMAEPNLYVQILIMVLNTIDSTHRWCCNLTEFYYFWEMRVVSTIVVVVSGL